MRMAALGGILISGLLAAGAARAQEMRLTSPDIAQGGTIKAAQVYKGFGCDGGNRSPALAWSGAPAGTKSFAVTMYDPDAPTGSGWWHWVIYDIPPNVTGLAEGAGNPYSPAAPRGSVEGRTDFGTTAYGGPCPPPGPAHHYILTVYALNVPRLSVPNNASAALIGFTIHAHTLAKGILTGLYGR
jgi:Raf kinase inhibitor-like YbhB/YbcL family protein